MKKKIKKKDIHNIYFTEVDTENCSGANEEIFQSVELQMLRYYCLPQKPVEGYLRMH